MKIEWKLLSYAMFLSVIVTWISSLIVSILVIQPLLDIWRYLPEILSGDVSVTIAEAKYSVPVIPLYVLLLLSLFFWCFLTLVFYVLMKSLKKQ